MYQQETDGIVVTVKPMYRRDQSSPSHSYYFYSYEVTIANQSDETIKLIERHWIIRDGKLRVEEVRGNSVVGLQPTIAPGEHFSYASGCPLPTPFGSMRGRYMFATSSGRKFQARIPLFFLRPPRKL